MNAGAGVLLSCVSCDEEGFLSFGLPFSPVTPSLRMRRDLRDVLMAEGAETGEGVAYRMYRGVYCDNDRGLFQRHGIRHDLTVISPGTIAGEFIKTYGHDHPACGNGLTYPEVYEVVAGKGCFLMQHLGAQGELEDVYVVEGRQGDKVVIPPGYGHVTVNASAGWLVIANLVADGWSSNYEIYRQKRGAAYYVLPGYRKVNFIPNPRYGPVPPLRRVQAGGLSGFGAREDLSLYEVFVANPKAFDFLLNPGRYVEVFQGIAAAGLKKA